MNKQTCERRMSEFGPQDRKEGLDTWESRDGIHPEDVISAIRDGAKIEHTTKGYKFYLHYSKSNELCQKVYTQHFNKEQIDMVNEVIKKFNAIFKI